MFVMHMPVTFKIGDTADCKINGEHKRLTWRDAQTLVIEPDDARVIVDRTTDGELIAFICSDADGTVNTHRGFLRNSGGIIVHDFLQFQLADQRRVALRPWRYTHGAQHSTG